MRLGRNGEPSLIIGFDVRVFSPLSGGDQAERMISFDPTVWASLRELAPQEALKAYEMKLMSDKSNGLNLFVDPPHLTVPEGYIVAAFDAPQDTVEYMCNSFGLQPALGRNSDELPKQGFSFLGYDVVDLWTQSSVLIGAGDLISNRVVRNRFGLIDKKDEAIVAAEDVDSMDISRAPFQAIGIWIQASVV